MDQIENLKILGDEQSKYIKYSYGDNTFELITDITILEDGTESKSISIFVTKSSGEKLQVECNKPKEILNSVELIVNDEDVDTNLNSITMLILNDMVNMKPIEKKEVEVEKKYTYWEYQWFDFKIGLIIMVVVIILGIIFGLFVVNQESEPDVFEYMTVLISNMNM